MTIGLTCDIIISWSGQGPTTVEVSAGKEYVMELNVTESLLKAILELIDKCKTLEELRESVQRIIGGETPAKR